MIFFQPKYVSVMIFVLLLSNRFCHGFFPRETTGPNMHERRTIKPTIGARISKEQHTKNLMDKNSPSSASSEDDHEKSLQTLMPIMGNSELDEEVYRDQQIPDDSGQVNSLSDTNIYSALESRKRELKEGIGKRYITRTQNGFLNVHYEPTDPFHTYNVVGKLKEGQIVTSTGPTRGFWVPHDGGGWSISYHGGFTWLEPIDE